MNCQVLIPLVNLFHFHNSIHSLIPQAFIDLLYSRKGSTVWDEKGKEDIIYHKETEISREKWLINNLLICDNSHAITILQVKMVSGLKE